MTLLKHDDVEVDVCRRCTGIFLDAEELSTLVKTHDPEYGSSFSEEFVQFSQDKYQGSCVSCGDMLYYCDIDEYTEINMTGCRSCNSFWLPQESLTLLKHHPRAKAALLDAITPFNYKHWFFQLISKLPVEFNIAPHKTPHMTRVFVALCAIAYIASLLPGDGLQGTFSLFALVPSEFPSLKSTINLLTSIFLHISIFHLLGNCYFLYVLGDNIEDAIGHKWFALFFISAGLAGSLLTVALSSSSMNPHVGASGAVAGLMGSYMVLFRHARLTFMLAVFQIKIQSFYFFLIWLLTNVIGVALKVKGVAWWAHIGGFVFGYAVTFILYKRIEAKYPIITLLNERLITHDVKKV